MDGLDKDQDQLSHEMFLHIADEHVLSDNKVLCIAETIRSYEGRHSIEPNLKAKLREHGMECDQFFDVFEEEFDIHYRDEENKKIIHKVCDLPKRIVDLCILASVLSNIFYFSISFTLWQIS